MSEIVLKQLVLENFCSIAELQIGLDSRGLLLIQGRNDDDPSASSNGAGKSSIVDGIEWVLYGETARGISGDAVVNRTAGKGCMGLIDFTDGPDNYTVTRYRKHKTGKNRLSLTQNGVDITKGTDKLTQAALEKILGCTREVFIASIYAGQERMPNLPALTDKELKTLIEEAAGTKILERAYEIARGRASEGRTNQADAQAALKGVQRLVNELDESVLTVQGNHDRWGEDQERRIINVQNDVLAATVATRAAQERLAEMDDAAIKAEIARIEAEITSSRPIPEELELKKLHHELARVAAEVQVKNAERSKALAALENIDNMVGKPCGECGREYTEHELPSRETLDARRKAAACELLPLARKQKDLQVKVSTLEAEIASIRKSRDTATLVAALREANEKARERARRVAAYDACVSNVHALKTHLSALQSETNPHVEMLKNLIVKRNAAAVQLETATKRFEQVAEQCLANEEAVKVFAPNGIRGEIIDVVTPFLNDRTSGYLSTLSDGNISASWNTIAETGKGEMREKFHIAVDNRNGADSFEGLSGGERRKVRIATAMALQDLVASRAYKPIKLFVGDELDDALDNAGLERLMAVLEDKARAVGSVLIISHNDIGDWVRNAVTVVKKGGTSRLEAA